MHLVLQSFTSALTLLDIVSKFSKHWSKGMSHYIRYNLDLSDPPNPQPQPHLHPAPNSNPNPNYTPPHPQSNFVSQCLLVKY